MAHHLTPVQRKVLRWMRDAEGQVTVQTGHKTTELMWLGNEAIVFCQSLVQYFLLHHGYMEKADGIARYRLTPKGADVASRFKEVR
jgi:predicted transcriptional regulator